MQDHTERTPASADEHGQLGRAVIYVRVSSAQQADTDYDKEGFSIPAQREACLRKASSLGLQVVEEFVDRGESARTANRQGLQRLLARVEQGDITHVIVHKVDRLARNRADDVAIAMKIKGHGAQLVSATENIDETPSGMLLHGIMSSIAEFYSRNLATEIIKGTTQKAKKGGTPYRAPIGYQNTREVVDDREIRTISIDPERGPLVQLAFDLYATGDYSLIDLAAILDARGLRSRPTRGRRPSSLGPNRLNEMLRSDYYTGTVRYAGGTYQGRHEPLVDQDTFDKVQQILRAQRTSGERSWRTHHYLRGTVHCAQCGRRLYFLRARGHGGLYDYFLCSGRQARICTQPYHRAAAVEAAVERHYAAVQLTSRQRQRIRDEIYAQLDQAAKIADRETARARAEIARLDNQERKLLTAHYDDAISDHIFADEQKRIRRERAAADRLLSSYALDHQLIRDTLELALGLTNDIQDAYRKAQPTERRLLNQALFERIEISTEEVDGSTLAAPFDQLITAEATRPTRPASRNRNARTSAALSTNGGSYVNAVVGAGGFEPP